MARPPKAYVPTKLTVFYGAEEPPPKTAQTELVALCRQRAHEATRGRTRAWWNYEAKMLEQDPAREEMVRRFLIFDSRLEAINRR